MRPIKISITGLNSFRETVTVDFEELGKYGLFGIFGKTGSGKSTILDAMTFALYGVIARYGSKYGQCINENESEAKVELEFCVADSIERRYIVRRAIRRKSNGEYGSATASLIELPGGVPIADKAKEVTQNVEEIIGLNYEEFVKTVVLPQGSFKEFLVMEGSERRKILERIFGLEKYGKKINSVIKSEKNVLNTQIKEIVGEIRGIGDISETSVAEEKRILEQTKLELANESLKVERSEAKAKEAESVLEMRAKIADIESEFSSLLEMESEILVLRKGQENSDKAAKLSPLVAEFEEKTAELEKSENEAKRLQFSFDDAYKKSVDAEEEYKKAKSRYDENYARGIEKKTLLETLEKDWEKLREIEDSYQKKKQEFELLEKERLKLSGDFALEKAEKERLEEELLQLDAASMLRSQLKVGDCCPVCGKEFDGESFACYDVPKTEHGISENAELHVLEERLLKVGKAKKQLEQKEEKLKLIEKKHSEYATELRLMKSGCDELKESLSSELETWENPRIQRSNVEKALNKIVSELEKTEELWEKSKVLRDEFREKLAAENYRKSSLKSDVQKQEERLKTGLEKHYSVLPLQLEDEDFRTALYQKIKNDYLDEGVFEANARKIKAYEEDCIRVKALRDGFKEQEKGGDYGDDELLELIEENAALHRKLEEHKKQVAVLENELENHKGALARKLQKQMELKKLEKRAEMLDLLGKLFEAGKFAEYMAIESLKYISLQASNTLMKISGGKYALIVDEQGTFKIQDFKNGGVIRSVKTMSGGETFIVSLSLALALSAQLQLKGRAPIELFFLDEGFGTLDDELLDVVMDSLEILANERFKIGIVSHVEKLKQRMPVRLMVSPQELGTGGSKLKIEYS